MTKTLEKGDYVKVVTQCVPSGLVPDKFAQLHYEYATEGSTKWYAIETHTRPEKIVGTLDSHKVYFLKPEIVKE